MSKERETFLVNLGAEVAMHETRLEIAQMLIKQVWHENTALEAEELDKLRLAVQSIEAIRTKMRKGLDL